MSLVVNTNVSSLTAQRALAFAGFKRVIGRAEKIFRNILKKSKKTCSEKTLRPIAVYMGDSGVSWGLLTGFGSHDPRVRYFQA